MTKPAMMEEQFEALMEVIEALIDMKLEDFPLVKHTFRFHELRQEFINVHIFGDEPEDD